MTKTHRLRVGLLAGALFLLCSVSSFAADLINIGVISSTENLNQDLVLQQVPLNITEAGDTLEIRWSPSTTGVFRYALGAPGNNLSSYSVLNNPLVSSPGLIRLRASRLPVGQLTCVITSPDGVDRSVFFQVLRASSFAPVPIGPITAAGGQGITELTPTFTWNSVSGVPYYLIFVADQPFTIVQDDQGTRVEGANVVWQAITSATSIQYGVQDPSGTIENEMVPPLIGSLNPVGRPRYNWTVLNSYGNSVEYTSSVVGTVAGFELSRAAPFASPTLISPVRSAEVFDNEILFQWSSIPQATSYLIYLSRFETYSNGTEILFPVWRVQTTDNAVICPAASILQNERYNWKVIAADGQGNGSLSDSSSFQFNIPSEEVQIRTFDTEGNSVDLARVEFETITGPGLLPVATDDEGRYTGRFPAGTYILHALKQGYVESASAPVQVLPNGPGRTVTITMEQRPSAFIGRVRTPGGTTISGATVRAVTASGVTRTATTNVSGEFYLPLNPGTYTLTALLAGYQDSAPRTLTLPLGVSMDLADNGGALVLTPYTYTVSGQVRNPASQAINLAQVRVTRGTQTFQMYTGESGQYSFTVGNGTWSLSATKPGFYLNSGPINVQIADGNATRNITLNPQAAIISGFTYLGSSPGGSSGLQVRAIPASGEAVVINPAENGSFSLGVAPGTYSLTAVLPGYTASPISMSLGPGQTANGIQLMLTPNPSTITGQVRTSSGTGVSQAQVFSGDVSVLSNSSGVYSLTLPAGEHTITAQKSGYSTAISGPWTVQHGQTISNVNLTTSPNVATVTGMVSHGGAGVVGATLTATPTSGTPIAVTTGSGGTYSVGLVPGQYTLTTAKSGFITLAPTTHSLNLQPGSQVSGRNFSLQPNIGTIIGTVTGAGGPVYGASVTVRRQGTTSGGIQTGTGVTGTFNVTVEPGHAYTIIATKQGYNNAETTTATINLGTEVNVTLTMNLLGSSVSGIVSSAGGNPLSGSTVIASSGGNSYSTTTGSGGSYTISFPPGTYTMDISAAGHHGTSGSVTTSPGQNRTGVNWSLQTNYALVAGVVNSADGGGVGGATIQLVRAGGGSRQVTADNAGFFQFEQVLGGSYTATASATGYASHTRNLGLIADGQVVGNADFTLQPLGSGFTGTVTAGATPIAEATVRATDPDGDTYTTVSSSNGSYTLSAIAAGTYTIEALKSGYTGTPVTGQSVSPGQTGTANLSLTANNGQITGTVSETGGYGLPDVLVTAQAPTGHFAQTSTAPTGTFSLTGLYPSTSYDLTFTKEGFGTTSRSSILNGANVQVELQRNSLTITGQTRNQAGTNVASVPVRATSLVDGTVLTATSNANGLYTLNEAAANTGYRIVTLYSHPNILDGDLTHTTGTSNSSNVHLEMIDRTASITGTVGTGGVLISAERSGGGTKSSYSEANGTYTLSGMRDGAWTLTPSKQGFNFSPATRTVSDLGVAETRTGINFTANSTTVTLSGRVVDDGGDPVSGIAVSRVSASGTNQVTTGEDGTYSFTSIPGYTTYTLAAVVPGDGYESQTLQVVTTNENVTGLEIMLTVRLGSVRGQVTSSETGNAVRPYTVSVDGGAPVTVNISSGNYLLSGLLRGDHILTFNAQGFTGTTRSFTLETGLDQDTVDVQLVPIVDGISFEVFHSITGSRTPIHGVHIDLSGNGEEWEAWTDASGLADIDGLTSGVTYTGVFTKPGFTTRTITNFSISNPNRDVQLEPAPNLISGIVRTIEGSLLEGAVVQLRGQDGTNRSIETDAFGSYELLRMEGPSTLIAVAPGDTQTSYIHTLAVPSGNYLMMDLAMRNAGMITGAVETGSGSAPASRALIETSNSTAGTHAFVRAREDGSYRIRGLRPGNFTVTLEAEGYLTPDPVELTMAAGETRTLDWTIEAEATSLTGRVVRAGTEVGIPNVTIDAVGPEILRTSTTGDGDFGFVDIEPGPYTLVASRHGYLEVERELTVPPGEVIGTLLEFTAVPNVASGIVYAPDGVTPNEGTIVNLFDSGNAVINADTTDSLGRYGLLIDVAGNYNVRPTGEYSPAQRSISHQVGQGHAELDFIRVVVQGEATVQGTVLYRGAGVPDVEITVQQIAGSARFTTTTDAGGFFTSTVTAPARYRINAFSELYGSISSSGFEVEVDSTITRQLSFASGQIGVTVVDEEETPVPNSLVTISAADGSYSTSLFTDGLGRAVTSATLNDGGYSISVSADDDLLPTAPVHRDITGGDSVGVRIPLGFAYTPPSIGNVGEGLIVEVRVPASYSFVSTLLYYRNVGENFFRTVVMEPAPSLSPGRGEIGRGHTSHSPGRGAAVDATGGAVSNLVPIKQSRQTTPVRDPFKKTLGGMDQYVVYQGEIPPQTGSGTLSFYPELITTDGLVIGGPSTVVEIVITSLGILHSIQVTPGLTETQPGVPVLFELRAYDSAGNNLTSMLQASGLVNWVSSVSQLRIEEISDRPDQAVYTASTEGLDTVRVEATQMLNDLPVTLRQALPLVNRHRELGSLSINAASLRVSSGDSLLLTATAFDTGGVSMQITPEWGLDTTLVGTLQEVEYTPTALFRAAPGRIGQAKITVSDLFTGVEAEFNNPDGRRAEGLAVFYRILSSPLGEFSAEDGAGAVVSGRFFSTALFDQQAELSLKRPNLAPLQRFYANLEAMNERGYRLLLSGSIDEERLVYTITLPLKAGAAERSPQIARWSIASLGWGMLGGAVSADKRSISVDIEPNDEGSVGIDGLYAVIVPAKPLAIDQLFFNPNPFSPLGDYPLSIEFTLHSLYPDVWLTIEIYNMIGQPVRRLYDRKPLAKGRFGRTDADHPPIIWDGLTDDGRMARNGRYVVRLLAEDASGKKERIETVVLIK